MINLHASRMGADPSTILKWTNGPRCKIPAWLNASNGDFEAWLNNSDGHVAMPNAWHSRAQSSDSKTQETERAMKFIYKFNPLQGYLADASVPCGGWGDWCCVCHGAQRRIACLPEVDRHTVDWFLTEDCCESKMAKNTSSPNFVSDATPLRSSSVAWHPVSGWVELEQNSSDSYDWEPIPTLMHSCPMLELVPIVLSSQDQMSHSRSGNLVAESSENVPLILPETPHGVVSPFGLGFTVFGMLFLYLAAIIFRKARNQRYVQLFKQHGACSEEESLRSANASYWELQELT